MFFKRKKKQPVQAEEPRELNALWTAYETGELEHKAYNAYVLCDYESGVNSEGHSGFLFNQRNSGDMTPKYLSALQAILPDHLYQNFFRAYSACDTDEEDEVCAVADDYFYENEQEVLDILREYNDHLIQEAVI